MKSFWKIKNLWRWVLHDSCPTTCLDLLRTYFSPATQLPRPGFNTIFALPQKHPTSKEPQEKAEFYVVLSHETISVVTVWWCLLPAVQTLT